LAIQFSGPGQSAAVEVECGGGIGIGRRRAEEIQGLLSELRSERPLATFLASRRRTEAWSTMFTAVLLFAVYRLVSCPPLPMWALSGWSAAAGAVLVLAAIVLPRLFLDGILTRPRPRRDWQAIGHVGSAVIAAVALLVSLLK
jgi:hypothetical protein